MILRRVAQRLANYLLSRPVCLRLANRFNLAPRFSRFHVAQVDRYCNEIGRLQHQIGQTGDDAYRARLSVLSNPRTFLYASRKSVLYSGAKTDLISVVSLLRPQETGHNLIRLGGDNDGGYLVPDDLDGLDFCFSPGVSDIATFERDCEVRGLKTFLADGSVSGPPDYLKNGEFIQKFVGSYTSSKTIAFDDWFMACVARCQDSEGILQMDIEGSEIETLMSMSEKVLRRFRIIVIEFHPMAHILNTEYRSLFEAVVRKLRQHFTTVHLHPNNGCPILQVGELEIPFVFEATFLRNDRINEMRPVLHLPHPLDQRNAPMNPEIYFSDHWLGQAANPDEIISRTRRMVTDDGP